MKIFQNSKWAFHQNPQAFDELSTKPSTVNLYEFIQFSYHSNFSTNDDFSRPAVSSRIHRDAQQLFWVSFCLFQSSDVNKIFIFVHHSLVISWFDEFSSVPFREKIRRNKKSVSRSFWILFDTFLFAQNGERKSLAALEVCVNKCKENIVFHDITLE